MAGFAGGRGVGLTIPKQNKARVSYSYTIRDMDGNEIGYITEFRYSSRRDTTVIHHINADDAGRPIEQAPNLYEDTVSVRGFALYNKSKTAKGSLLNRLPGSTADAFYHIAQQGEYFIIEKTARHLGDPDAYPEEAHTIVYAGCMLTSYEEPIAINDVYIAESADIKILWVEEG